MLPAPGRTAAYAAWDWPSPILCESVVKRRFCNRFA